MCMISFFFLLCLVTITPLSLIHASPDPTIGYLINCGALKDVEDENGLKYVSDQTYISVGNITSIEQPGVLPILTTLRYFPDASARKNCYNLEVIKGEKYLIRTTFYYGGFDGGEEPPVFDQVIDGTLWSTVNTTEDYASGLSSYYEIIATAHGKILSLCLARNGHTVSSPFISAIEVQHLDKSLYNSTDFETYALSTIARTNFGSGAEIISYPDDPYNRFWQPYMDFNNVEKNHVNVTPSDFWNNPPAKVFQEAVAGVLGNTLTIKWTTFSLPSNYYYIALYFQDTRTQAPLNWRVFNVSVNGETFYANLNVTTKGVSVYGSEWPVHGTIELSMTPRSDMLVGPVINAGEIFQILPLKGRTLTRDVMVMEELGKSLDSPPSDWSGDPCLPKQYSWTGVTCTGGKNVRILTLNLTSQGISGTLPKDIGKLTAISSIWLGGNKLSGTIPDMSTMKSLESLHLDNNQFEGPFPQWLAQLPNLRELFLQNNKLTGTVPNSLTSRKDIYLQVAGNNLVNNI